jgi:hypothetical protein
MAKKIKIFQSTLRPGLLVNIRTSIKGNVSYEKTEGEVFIDINGAEHSEWETEKTVKDPLEQKRATEVRSKARNLIVSVCAPTDFGLLCPETSREKLDEAFTAARALCAEFNATSKTTTVKFAAIAGRIAPDDLEAVRAINGEVRDLLSEMTAGIDTLDVERVRDAANRTVKLGNMLAPDAQARIKETIDAVRAMATKMKSAGETAALEIDKTVLKRLASARTAFLDLDDATVVRVPVDTSGRVLDLAPHEETSVVPAARTKSKAKAREMEFTAEPVKAPRKRKRMID